MNFPEYVQAWRYFEQKWVFVGAVEIDLSGKCVDLALSTDAVLIASAQERHNFLGRDILYHLVSLCIQYETSLGLNTLASKYQY